jgi:hypothetical protein
MQEETLEYLHSMAKELAVLAETQEIGFLAYIFRLAEQGARDLLGDEAEEGDLKECRQ